MKKIPTNTVCAFCGKPIKEGDKNIGFFKRTNDYMCEDCTNEKVGCESYARVVGYISPVRQWNNGKSEEFKERKMFKI